MQVNVVEEREQKFKEISLKTKGDDMRQTFWRKNTSGRNEEVGSNEAQLHNFSSL